MQGNQKNSIFSKFAAGFPEIGYLNGK